MAIKGLFDADSFFRPEEKIKSFITCSKNYEGEDPKSGHLLKFFSTSKQRTYLVSTGKRMYCILDDSRKDDPQVRWSIPRNELEQDGNVIMAISTSDQTQNTGLISIGPKHKNWLFTKTLFREAELTESVKKLILDSVTCI